MNLRRIARIICVALAIAMVIPTGIAANAAQYSTSGYVEATASVNLRAQPNLSGKDLATLSKGETAAFLGSISTDSRGVDWYYVSYGGLTGWVSSKYSKIVSWQSSSGYVQATGSVNLRSGPGLTYTDLGTMAKGESAEYLGCTSTDSRGIDWYLVSYGGQAAWISSKYSKLTGSQNAGTGTSAGTVRATGSVNIRSTPLLTGTHVATMSKGKTATYLGTSSVDSRGVTWYYVDYNGTVGWVSSKYSTLSSSSGENSQTTSYGYIKATASVNLRSGPGLSYTDLATLFKNETATYLGSSSVDERGVRWYKVYYGGLTGWVSSKYCNLY